MADEPCPPLADDHISVANFLETELYFEMAEYLRVRVSQLRAVKDAHPEAFKDATCYVLEHVVTPECRSYILDKVERAASSRLAARGVANSDWASTS
tara:strand:- start:125 stop:415 length:291 start_codon:yes stop_codon:yes gene_type:complete